MPDYSTAAIVAEGRGGKPQLYHREISAPDAGAARERASAELAAHVAGLGGEVRRDVGVKEIPRGHTSVAALYVNSVGDARLAHGTDGRTGREVRDHLRDHPPPEVRRGERLDQVSTVDAADRARGRMREAERHAGRVIDSYEANTRYMDADTARAKTLSAVSKVARDESGLKGEAAQRFEISAFKAGQSALSYYADRIEEGFSARAARASAVVAAREGQRERGTMDVREFARGAIETYATHEPHRGRDDARKAAVLAAAENASALRGVNLARAGRVAEAAIERYQEHRDRAGVGHDVARHASASEMARRYDERGYEADRERGREVERDRSRTASLGR